MASKPKPGKQKQSDAALEELYTFGLALPGAHTKAPWPGHRDLAVNDKTFAYMSLPGEPLSISCKLPHTADAALELPFTSPTEYGLGKSGWVSASVPEGELVPVELFKQWIDESYRAQAPKRLSKGLAPFGEFAPAALPAKATRGKPPAKAKAATTKAAKQKTAKTIRAKPVAPRKKKAARRESR
jgi:predicted DNA-binding protein (MmcQ/YjbR family)